jgi:N-acetylglutamate synthase-like GNAT family acetyltransferase
MEYVNLTNENLASEHICCAIADKKHQCGVDTKKQWLGEQIKEGHTFRKLDERGKVFIEYAPLEKAWVSVEGKNFVFIYCLWVAGSFKGKGIGKELLNYCITDAKQKGKSGVCVICGKSKKPFLSDKAFMQKFGFVTVDKIDDFELLALSFDGTKPHFTENAKKQTIESKDLTIYYGLQCPYIPNCVAEIESYCKSNKVPCNFIKVDTLEKAKTAPCVFNNWAVFYNGKYVTNHLLNETLLKKLVL